MGASVRIRNSHCTRTRCMSSECAACADACAAGAITLSPSPEIDGIECTGCLACVAACPTAALDAPQVLFWEALRQLAAVERPVLGCSAASPTRARATLPCLAYLADEHLAALALLLPGGATFDVSACEECESGAALEHLTQRMRHLETSMPVIVERIRLVDDEAELGYEAAATDRRGFFSALGRMVRTQAVSLKAENANAELADISLSEKEIPFRRSVLTGTANALADRGETEALRQLSASLCFSAVTSEECELCFGCVGVCPNGALESFDGDVEASGRSIYAEQLLFISARCSGCGVCSDACTSGAIEIRRGHEAENVTAWRVIHQYCADSSVA